MANSRVKAPLLIGVAVVFVGLLAWLVLRDPTTGAPNDGGAVPETVREAQTSENAVATGAAKGTASRSVASAARVDLPATEKPLPPAFEKALAGIGGRIVEPDGVPVPGATVDLLGGLIEYITLDIDKLLFEPDSYAVNITKQTAQSGADGRFQFTKIDPRGYFMIGVNLGKGRPAFRLVDNTPMPGESVDLGDIALDPRLTIIGRVVDEGGKPIQGARVRATNAPALIFQSGVAHLNPGTGLYARMGNGKSAPRIVWKMPLWTDQIFAKLPLVPAQTGADGRFRLEGAPAGQLTLLIDAPGIPATFQTFPATKAAEKDVADVSISRGEVVEGVVVDEQDAPVANAEVVLGIPSPLAAENIAFLRKPVKTNAEGKFVISGVPGRKAFFLARAPEQLDWTTDDAYELTGDEIKISVPASRSILVTVQDEGGKPLAARVAVQRAMEGMSLFPQVETPFVAKPEIVATGQYRIRGLKQGEFWVYARAPGFEIAKEKVKIEATGEPTVLLGCKREFAIECTVLGKENGKPVPLEMATVGGAPDGREAEAMGFLALGSAKTNEEGVAMVRALGKGNFNIIASHPAYAMGLSEVTIPETRSTTIQLLVGGNIKGRVVRGALPPEKPMMVALAPNGEKTIQLPKSSITDLDGNFSFKHLAPGKYKVIALKRFLNENLVSVNPMEFMRLAEENADQDCEVTDEQTTEMLLDLAKGGRKDNADDGTITGSAYINGIPAEGDYVMASGPEWVRPKKVDGSGSFNLGRVKPGEYSITLTKGTPGMGDAMRGPVAARRVNVKATDSVFVDLNIKTGKITGVVKDPGGKPVSGARVRINSTENRNDFGGGPPMRTDENGRFTVDEIGSGNYNITASVRDYANTSVSVSVRGGTTETVEIVVTKAVTLEGTIDGPLPENASWISVELQRKMPDGTFGSSNWASRQGEDKRTFIATSLAPGTYRARVRAFGEKPVNYKFVEIEVGAGGASGVVIRAEEDVPAK